MLPNVSARSASVLSERQIQDLKLMSEELNPELEGQIQETAAAEVEATPEVEVAEVAAALEVADDVADEDELELVLDIEEEDEAFDWNSYESGYGARSE